MSTDQETDVEELAAKIAQDDELREAFLDEVVDQMNVDGDTPEGEAAQATRRDALKAIGAGGAAGLGIVGAFREGTRRARAGSGQSGSQGTQSNPNDYVAEDLQLENQSANAVANALSGYRSLGFENGTLTPRDGAGNLADVQAGAVTTDEVFTTSRTADIIVHKPNTEWVATGDGSQIASNSSLASMVQSAHDDLTGGGHIHIKTGTVNHDWDSLVTVNNPGIKFTSSGMLAGGLRASTSIPAFFEVEVSGAHLDNGPTFQDMRFVCNSGNATWGVKVDSSSHGHLFRCKVESPGTGGFQFKCDESASFIDFWDVEKCWVADGSVHTHMLAGSGGHATDCRITNCCHLTSPDDWSYKIEDCERITLENVYATSSDTSYPGTVLVTAPGTASGSPSGMEGTVVDGVYMEVPDSQPTAVKVDADGSTGLRNTDIREVKVAPNGATQVELKDSGGNANHRGTEIENLQTRPSGTATMVEIGSGVQNANLKFNASNSVDLSARISDSGNETRYYGVIGGGPLGGVDLALTNGRFDGDRAIADGSSAASAGDLARWDASDTEWDIHTPDSTI